MDTGFPMSVFQFAERQGIVEVLGIGRIDRECRNVAIIQPVGNLFRSAAVGNTFGRLDYLLRILVRQAVFGQDGVHLGIVFSLMAQYVYHSADGVLREGRPTFKIDHYLIAVLCLLEQFVRNVDILV